MDLSLQGLRDAQLVLAPAENRPEIAAFWDELLSLDEYNIRRPEGEEGLPRVQDAFREYYRLLKRGMVERGDRLGYELLVGPFTLSGRHMSDPLL